MAKFEEIELGAHRDQMIHDVKKLVEKYRAILDWDIANIDQARAERATVRDGTAKILAVLLDFANRACGFSEASRSNWLWAQFRANPALAKNR